MPRELADKRATEAINSDALTCPRRHATGFEYDVSVELVQLATYSTCALVRPSFESSIIVALFHVK